MPEQKQLTEEELQNLSQDEIVALFVEQLLVDKGEGATDQRRMELAEEISDKINVEVLGRMSDETLDRLNAALDNPNSTDGEIEEIIMNSGVNVAEVTEKILMDFREEYLGKERM